jgi:hypothetical protein
MRRQHRNIILALIVLIPVIGYGIMHLSVYLLPVSGESLWGDLAFTLLLIFLGLAIPYWMLKLAFHRAHMRNPEEKDMHLSDLPKDKDDLVHPHSHARR